MNRHNSYRENTQGHFNGFTLQEVLVSMIAASVIVLLILQLLGTGWSRFSVLQSTWVQPFGELKARESLARAQSEARLVVTDRDGTWYFLQADGDTLLRLSDSLYHHLSITANASSLTGATP